MLYWSTFKWSKHLQEESVQLKQVQYFLWILVKWKERNHNFKSLVFSFTLDTFLITIWSFEGYEHEYFLLTFRALTLRSCRKWFPFTCFPWKARKASAVLCINALSGAIGKIQECWKQWFFFEQCGWMNNLKLLSTLIIYITTKTRTLPLYD